MASPRILVAVDDEHARGLLTAVLRAGGHVVDATGDRAETLSLIERHAYTLVLGALRMPGLPGPELVRALEDRQPLDMPALVFLARPAYAPDMAQFLMESAAALLEWPASPADINRVVARVQAPAPA